MKKKFYHKNAIKIELDPNIKQFSIILSNIISTVACPIKSEE